MARTCGLRVGPRRFELVILDGSSKKHRIAGFMAGEFPGDADDPVQGAISILRGMAKEHAIPLDNIGLVIDTGMASFRTIKLPFEDQSKIEQVIKFEVESQLPHLNIDDVVVDFIKLASDAGNSSLLTTAVPKKDLGAVLALCSQAGLEPHEAELEATAMVNASIGADICHEDDAQVLVHVGEYSTAAVIMDAGQVHSIRAIRMGALTYAGGATSNDEDEGAEAPDPDEVQERVEQVVSRLRRELTRTITGAQTKNAIDAVYICGMELPGLVGSSVDDVPIYMLDVFEEDSGQPAEGTAPLVVAYGAALRQLGGGTLRPSLRREELRFTGKLERIELPLAMAAVLLVTGMVVFTIFEVHQLKLRDQEVAAWQASAHNFMLGDPKKAIPGNLGIPVPAIQKYALDAQAGKDTQRDRIGQLENLEWLLKQEIKNIQKELGQTTEVIQPQSALEGTTLTLGVMAQMGARLGRVSLHKVDSMYMAGRGGREDKVRVRLDVTFFGENAAEATSNFEAFKNTIRGEPWCDSVDDSGSVPLDGVGGIHVAGLTMILDLDNTDSRRDES